MKKVLSVILALAMVFCLAACGSDSSDDDNTSLYSKGLSKDGTYDFKALSYVTLPEYKGVDFGEEFNTVSDEDLQSSIDSILSSYAETNEVYNRAIVDGDQVNIDYIGTIDGVAFDGGSAQGATVTAGSNQFIDDFLDQIIGHIPGDKFSVEVTFPEDYNSEELAGKDASFVTTINYIEESVNPELTDEFVAENLAESYNATTVAELNTVLYNNLLESNRMTLIEDYLSENTIITEVPGVAAEHQENCLRQKYTDYASMYGVDVDTFIQYYGGESLDALIEESEESIIELARIAMIYQAIAEENNISVKNTDVADYFEESNGSRDYSTYQEHYGLPYLKMIVMHDKVTNLIVDSAIK